MTTQPTTTFNGNLTVNIADAQVNETQHLSKQDPYCIITLGSSGLKRMMEGSHLGKEKYKTKVHNGAGTHPVWNEEHTFNLKNMKMDSHIKVKLYDKDTIKDDSIGVARINLDELLLKDKKGVQYYPLYKKGTLGQSTAKPIGQVGLGVVFDCVEIPQGHSDLKSQATDALTRKQQQMSGVPQGAQTAQQPIMGTQAQQPMMGTQGQGTVNQPIQSGTSKVPFSQVPQTQTQVPQTQGQFPQGQQGHY